MSDNQFKLEIFPDIDCSSGKNLVLFFSTKDEMLAASSSCADLLLFLQDDIFLMDDRSNMFIQSQIVDGEYEEIEE